MNVTEPGCAAALAESSQAYREMRLALSRMAIVDTHTPAKFVPLAGGVSSDIYRVETPGATFCVKRALPRLKVAADWRVPVDRNRYEIAWLETAAGILPGSVPRVLGVDTEGGAFAMAWLDPVHHPVWKAELRDGRIDPGYAAAVGERLGRLHAATAGRDDIAARFPTDALFHAIRLEPYLEATARAHPDLAARLHALVATTAGTRLALVHGDMSPKNILVGPDGPVFLDAECAWYGDPAFDLAFLLNHLLLKGAWKPRWRARYLAAFDALVAAYRAHVDWEPWDEHEARTAALLPALMLARVDGKSPVEYLADEAAKAPVRAFARAQVASARTRLHGIGQDWREAPLVAPSGGDREG
jgi:aminoglycoside phosphotransferase (APT) family kinase protein